MWQIKGHERGRNGETCTLFMTPGGCVWDGERGSRLICETMCAGGGRETNQSTSEEWMRSVPAQPTLLANVFVQQSGCVNATRSSCVEGEQHSHADLTRTCATAAQTPMDAPSIAFPQRFDLPPCANKRSGKRVVSTRDVDGTCSEMGEKTTSGQKNSERALQFTCCEVTSDF